MATNRNLPIYLGAITTDLLEMEGILGGYAPEIIRNKPTKFFGWVFIHLHSSCPIRLRDMLGQERCVISQQTHQH